MSKSNGGAYAPGPFNEPPKPEQLDPFDKPEPQPGDPPDPFSEPEPGQPDPSDEPEPQTGDPLDVVLINTISGAVIGVL